MNRDSLIEVKVIRHAEQNTSNWSGGTTTELSIWPDGADYKERRFDWRISSARVDLDESTFTALPGIHRSLMILEGAIHLMQEGIRERNMTPLTTADEFEGSWTTKSTGRCVDFNLMTSDKCRGAIETVEPKCSAIRLFEEEHGETWETFYCLASSINLTIKSERYREDICLMQGDFLKISKKSPLQLEYNLVIKEIFDKAPMVRTTVYRLK